MGPEIIAVLAFVMAALAAIFSLAVIAFCYLRRLWPEIGYPDNALATILLLILLQLVAVFGVATYNLPQTRNHYEYR
jgi:hypothetical protein